MTEAQGKKVTAIEVQTKNRRRRNVYLDGEFAFGIHQEVLLDSGFGIGDTLGEHDIAAIIFAEGTHKAKEKALRLLSVRARSEQEMRRRLRETDIEDAIIDRVVTNLLRLGLLDDEAFASSFARNKVVTRPCGEIVLRRELKNKGVSENHIAQALEEAYKERSQDEIAKTLAIKKKQQLSRYDELKAKKRTTDFLLRRGFTWDIVSDILDTWDQL